MKCPSTRGDLQIRSTRRAIGRDRAPTRPPNRQHGADVRRFWPITVAGRLCAAARREDVRGLSGDADTITRDADSPKSAAASFKRGIACNRDRVERHIDARSVSAKAALGERDCQSAIRAVVRGHESAVRPRAPRRDSEARASAARSSAGGRPRHDRARPSDTRCRRARRVLHRAARSHRPASGSAARARGRRARAGRRRR